MNVFKFQKLKMNLRKWISLGLILLSGCYTYAQDFSNMPVVNYANPQEYEIAGISISGVQYLDQGVLVNLSGLSIGQKITIPGDDITAVIKKYWDQGLFSDVKVSISKIEGNKVYLDIYLRERPRLAKLKIEGVNHSDEQDLLEKINMRTGSQVTENILNNTTNIIKKHYIDKGFFDVDVNIVQQKDTTTANRVDVTIKIDKNQRVKIDDIVFRGNQAFPDSRLRRVMKKTKKKNWNIFKSSKYIQKDFETDKASLIDFYNENGYRDASITGDSVQVLNDKRIRLYIDIKEGDQYFFRNITWVGNTKYPSELLSSILGIEKGDVFDKSLLDKRLQSDEDAVSSVYLDNGYLFFQVIPVETKIENDSIDLEMRIYEGKQATINQVIIKGNTKTNEHVIRRELRTKPGDLFSKSDIMRSVRELAQLGHFDPEKINPVPKPNPADGTVDIEYDLVEKPNDQLEISGGWGANMLVGTIGLRFSNFSARRILDPKAWRPVPSGDGQTLSIRAQSNGKYYRSYNFSFMEPWFGGKKPNSFSISFYHSKMTQYTSLFQPSSSYMNVSGASIGLGRRLKWPDDYFTLYNEINYQKYKLVDYPGYFKFANGTSNNLSFLTSFSRNSVDQPIYPRHGSKFTFSLQLTPPYSLLENKNFKNATDNVKYKWIEYHKWTFKADWYLKLAGNLVMMTRAHFGFLGYYNKDIGPSPFESFDLGGDGMSGYNLYGRETIGLRGYENSSLTPIVGGTKAGNIYDKYTMELRYPISLNPQATVFALTFLEAGNAWYDFQSFNPFLVKRSAGVGIRAFLPMFGLLGIDWGYGFDEIPGNPGANGGQFHFVIGQQF